MVAVDPASLASCPAGAAFMSLLLSNVALLDFPQSSTAANEEFDFIVIGGGTAGCVVAGRLSENTDFRVLLLEAGGDEPQVTMVPAMYNAQLQYKDLHWHLKTERSDGLDRDQVVQRGKMIGGSGAHNAMIYLRGNKYDYEEWEKLGAKGWGYDDVLPFFLKSEDNLNFKLAKDKKYHNTTGPVDVSFSAYQDPHVETIFKVLEEAGLNQVDPNMAYKLGFFEAQLTLGPDGQRRSTNRGYIVPNRNRTNLRVVTNALVQKVNINPDTKKAESVEYINHNGETITMVAKKEIVLSAGAYFSPHLLMLSGVGPADHLKEAGIEPIVDLPGVGQHLTDHFNNDFNTILNMSHIPSLEEVFADGESYTRGEGPWTAMGPLTVTVLRRSTLQPSNDMRPHLKTAFSPAWRDDDPKTPAELCFPVNSALCYYNQLPFNTEVIHPVSVGHLRLNLTSPQSHPLIYQNVFSDERDIRKQAEGARWIWEKFSNSSVLEKAGVNVYLPEQPACDQPGLVKYSQEYFECGVRNGESTSDGHGSGTCKMGADDDPLAVLDPELRVRGVKGLRVVDASVFPAITSGNINVPVLMVGERGAAFIQQTWQ